MLAQLRALLFYRFSHTFVRVRMLKHNSLSWRRREGAGTALVCWEPHDSKRIDSCLVRTYALMQVHPCRASGGAYSPQGCADFHNFTHRDGNCFRVSVEGVQAQAVVEHDSISGEEQLIC